MQKFHDKHFPGESEEYRQARDKLLAAEITLRKQIEEVAAWRRQLPLGGKLKADYLFDEGAIDLSDQKTIKQTKFSELFAKGKPSLIIYSFMYAPEADKPCPMCTSILDGLNGTTPHARDCVNFVVVAKAPIQKIRRWAWERSWNNLRLLSSEKNTYNTDYFAEDSPARQLPALNVFTKTDEGINHFYNTELLYSPTEKGQNPRHVDLIWPLWNMFDLTPEGRGTNWFPKFAY